MMCIGQQMHGSNMPWGPKRDACEHEGQLSGWELEGSWARAQSIDARCAGAGWKQDPRMMLHAAGRPRPMHGNFHLALSCSMWGM